MSKFKGHSSDNSHFASLKPLIYFNDGPPDAWIILGKQRIDVEAAKEGCYDFLVSRTRLFNRVPKGYLYYARAIAVEAYRTERENRIQKKLDFWKVDLDLYNLENEILPALTPAAFLIQTLTIRTTNATNVVDAVWGNVNFLDENSTEADILLVASLSTIYKIDQAFQRSNDSFEKSEKEGIRIKAQACKILIERLGPNALAAGRASFDAQNYPQAYEDIHMHFLKIIMQIHKKSFKSKNNFKIKTTTTAAITITTTTTHNSNNIIMHREGMILMREMRMVEIAPFILNEVVVVEVVIMVVIMRIL